MRATITSDQANVAKLQADEAYATANGKRVQDLTTQGIDTKDQLDFAVSTSNCRRRVWTGDRVLQARAQLEQAQAQVDSARVGIRP